MTDCAFTKAAGGQRAKPERLGVNMHTPETIKVVPARYPLRAVGAALALLALAVVIQSVAFNPRWEWGVCPLVL